MPLVLTRSAGLRLSAFTTLYFAQGVPIGLFSVAIPAWLAETGASAGTIAKYAGVVVLPWAFKLIAGPLMDRFAFPAMGFRRPWVLVAQTGLVVSFLACAAIVAAMSAQWEGATANADALGVLMLGGFVINVFAASQDVAVDGMAIDVLPSNERGRANAAMACGQVMGYSIYGYICALLLTRFGVAATMLCCAVTVAAILLFATAVRERPAERLLPWTAGTPTVRAEVAQKTLPQIGTELTSVLVLPMSLLLVAVEFLNRCRDGVAVAVFPTFAVSLGYTAEQYAWANSWVGIVAAAVGAALGRLIDATGAYRFLVGALLLSAACHLLAGLMPALFDSADTLVALWVATAIATQLVFVAIIALFMNLCWSKVAATQFAVYMSLANLSRSAGGIAFAQISDRLTFAQDFLLMAALLLLAAALLRFFQPEKHAAHLAEWSERRLLANEIAEQE